MQKSIHSEQSRILRQWLKEKRASSSLTIRDLAKLLDAHHSIIGKVETGERRLDVIEWIEYCDALGAVPHECVELLLHTKFEPA